MVFIRAIVHHARRHVHQPPAMRYTKQLEPVEPSSRAIPAFRVLDLDGALLDKTECVKMMQDMLTIRVLDDILYNAQRQGRISFYLTNTGEEGCQVGSAAALHPDDHIYGQYREVGALLHRGFHLSAVMNQCFGNCKDPGKGKQMPVHYGSKEHRFFTISSPLGTQIPHAAGAAYALKLDGKQNVVLCYFGEGAASEGDFHAGVNIAATTESPVVFFCRNNGYAISTPTSDQYRGDGIVSRAAGYGIPGFRVDGNDPLATYVATKRARQMALERNTPVLVEAITYRVGHHSTSDDSLTYRSKEEVEEWAGGNDPLTRFGHYLESKKWWDRGEGEERFKKAIRQQVIQEMLAAEKEPKPPISDMFDDVYDELPRHLKEQKAELKALLEEQPQDFEEIGRHRPWRE